MGNYLQNRAHVGLANLRKGKGWLMKYNAVLFIFHEKILSTTYILFFVDKKEAMGHQIPRGGLFEYISCPNYFGEIIIYSSMAILFGLRNASWNSCLLWVICNQVKNLQYFMNLMNTYREYAYCIYDVLIFYKQKIFSPQITSGIMNHQWYISTFQSYPKQRKAVIPFIL